MAPSDVFCGEEGDVTKHARRSRPDPGPDPEPEKEVEPLATAETVGAEGNETGGEKFKSVSIGGTMIIPNLPEVMAAAATELDLRPLRGGGANSTARNRAMISAMVKLHPMNVASKRSAIVRNASPTPAAVGALSICRTKLSLRSMRGGSSVRRLTRWDK